MVDTSLRDRRILLNKGLDDILNSKKISLNAGLDEILEGIEAVKESERINPIFGLPDKESWGTTMKLTQNQWEAYKGALTRGVTSDIRLGMMEERAPELGLGKEYDEYIKDYGETWGVTDVTTPLFDTLLSTSTAAPTGLDAVLETGDIWKGFVASANEIFTGWPLIPGYSRLITPSGGPPEPVRLGWTEFGDKYGMLDIVDDRLDPLGLLPKDKLDQVRNWVGLFMMDMIVEPLNIVPGGAIATTAAKILRKSRLVPGAKAAEKTADFFFKTHPDLPDEFRKDLISLKTRFGATAQNDAVHLMDEIDGMMANLDWIEERILGTLMDQPAFMREQVEALVESGVLKEGKAAEIFAKAELIRKFTKRIFDAEAAAPLGGLIDENMFRDLYLHGAEARDPLLVKAYQQSGKRRSTYTTQTSERSFLPGLAVDMPAAFPKKYEHHLDRVMAGFDGGRTTELSIGNILKNRSFMHVMHMNSRRLAEAVLTNPELSHKISLPPEFFQGKTKIDGMTWPEWKINYEEKSGRSIKLITKRRFTPRTSTEVAGKVTEDVIGAWGLPREVKQFIEYGEELVSDPKQWEAYTKAFDDITNIWKGWATFGTGYHARNTLSILNSNWMAGVGRLADGTFSPADFMLKNLQAIKLMSIATGAGRLPVRMRKHADRVAKYYGWDSLDAIPDLKIKGPDGNPLSYAEIAEYGENYGVPQSATALFNIDSSLPAKLWEGVGDMTTLSGDLGKVDPRLAKVLSFGEGVRKPWGQVIRETVGTENGALKFNRAAAQIIENQGRWTLFLDSLSKGMPVEVAAEMPRLWHYDYRMLTDVEKKVFRRIMPFYAWQRFSAPRAVMALMNDPAHLAKMAKTKADVEALYPDFRESETPDYWDEVMMWQIPYISRDKEQSGPMPVGITLETILLELNKGNVKDLLSGVNPLLTAPIEAGFNWNLFMDMPLERFEGQWTTRYEGDDEAARERRKETVFGMEVGPWTRKNEFLWSKLFPPMGKYLRYKSAEARGTEGRQLLGELSGIKAKVLDVQRVLRGKVHKKDKALKDFWKKLEQRALDDPEFAAMFPELIPYKPRVSLPFLPYINIRSDLGQADPRKRLK